MINKRNDLVLIRIIFINLHIFCFYTPLGFKTNAMILGSGNYSFKDFLLVGGILCLLFWGLVTWLIPAFYL